MGDRVLQDPFKFAAKYMCHLEYQLGFDPKGTKKVLKEKLKDSKNFYSFDITDLDKSSPEVLGPFFNGLGGEKRVLSWN